ncbi:prepilin-type N-terminal cleavage/methylation domain-containing protein [Methylophilus rhizosphaerae]|uniref:Prepilin-type N-terminal cleavage/methylation domain-containing protein n=1 Tax=Methylophilus rhizosphaerae TaxID=492660 RepID=A0A1G9E1K3_9PROT|nr:prepilin-type N-terminal cleavage/methylation domain-containing protein [Methylophilus rhizosphaerae]SDK70046.1 prepilin-type N-terminal cleavage/methylation domain-containing protein [Methylophilus rhizosphaerae]
MMPGRVIDAGKRMAHIHAQGFSLLELAIALVILSLMMGWLMTPLRVQHSMQKYQQTEQRLQLAQQALLGHALIHHYLPCPDTDSPPDGWENVLSSQRCASDEGVLPWAQLGLVATDAWGRYFRYRADATFTHHAQWFSVAAAEGASNIQVTGESGAATSITSRPAAIVLSHGENGLGGIQSVSGGLTHAMAAPLHPDEQENADGDLLFVDKTQQQTGNAVFDDRLVMLSSKVLIQQMVQAQRLP